MTLALPLSERKVRSMEEKQVFISLANEIIGQCSTNSIAVPLDLCTYLMDLKLLKFSKNISSVTQKADVMQKLIKMCVEDLKKDSFSVKTLKLQLFWKKKYQTRDEIKKIHHERIFKNILPILSEIVDDNLILTPDKDNIYKKIVFFVIMFAGLGSPAQKSIVKETQAALQSIFKATEIDNFLSLPKTTKEQQLVEFSQLITGIVLFNKDCKKGGEGMDDLPLILTQGVRATKERLLAFKDQLDQKIDNIVNPIQCHTINNLQNVEEKTDYANSESTPPGIEKEKLKELIPLLIYFRQIEHFLIDLIKDLEKSFVAVDELVKRLQSALLQIHNVVRYRVAVATVQVFPLFLQLSNVWVEMQEEVDILSEINNNFADLSSAAEPALETILELPLSAESAPSPTNDEIRQGSDFYPGVKVCSISSVSNREHLQYKGFCAWTLAYTEGLLVTGNIALGVLQFSNRFYIFSSAEAAYKWAVDPNYFTKGVLKLARVKPELIKFLNLEDDLLEKMVVEEDQKPTVANSEVQTELHPIESLISRDYTFSEWEIKRRAIRLATLTRYVTRSQQTVKRSCFRAEMGVQVTPCVNVGTQTVKDGFCNHPAAPTYAWSLRTELSEFLIPSAANSVKK